MNAVLDTNVWLDWLVFDDPATRGLHEAARSGSLVLVASSSTRAEWLDVIERPVFGLDTGARSAVNERYERYVVLHEPAEPAPKICNEGLRAGARLLCRDADDQKFLDLAIAIRASYLLTRDRALLELARRAWQHYGLAIVRPDSPAWRAALTDCPAAASARAHL